MLPSLLARFERNPHLPLVAVVAAMWPVWPWMATRAASDSADAWALLSLATAVALIWRDRSGGGVRAGFARTRLEPAGFAWSVPALLMLVYAVSYPFALPLVRAVVAMSALAV